MDITAIKYFLCLAECMNFSEAAARNYISQSSFSKIIMKLEKEIGVQLIDRKHHPIALTKGGECFYRHFKAMEPIYEEAMEDLMNYSDSEEISVLICPKSYAYKDALNDFVISTAGASVRFTETTDYHEVVGAMLTGNYTFSISSRPLIVPPQLRATELYSDSLYLAVSKHSAFAQRKQISLKDLDGEVLVESAFSKHVVEELMKQFSFQPKRIIPDDGTDMRREEMVHRVMMGIGTSVNPGRDITAFKGSDIICLPIREMVEFPVVLLEQVDGTDSFMKQHFRNWMKTHLESYVYSKLDAAGGSGI